MRRIVVLLLACAFRCNYSEDDAAWDWAKCPVGKARSPLGRRWAIATALPDMPRGQARDAVLALASALRGGPWLGRRKKGPPLYLLVHNRKQAREIVTARELALFDITPLFVPSLPDIKGELYGGLCESAGMCFPSSHSGRADQLLALQLFNPDVASGPLRSIETVVFLAADRVVLSGCEHGSNGCDAWIGDALASGRMCPAGFQCFAEDERWGAGKEDRQLLPLGFDTSVMVVRPHLREAPRFFQETLALIKGGRAIWTSMLRARWSTALSGDTDGGPQSLLGERDSTVELLDDARFEMYLQSAASLWNIALASLAQLGCTSAFAGHWRVSWDDDATSHVEVNCTGLEAIIRRSDGEATTLPLLATTAEQHFLWTIAEAGANAGKVYVRDAAGRKGAVERLYRGGIFMPACTLKGGPLAFGASRPEFMPSVRSSTNDNDAFRRWIDRHRQLRIVRWMRETLPPWLGGPSERSMLNSPVPVITTADSAPPSEALCTWQGHWSRSQGRRLLSSTGALASKQKSCLQTSRAQRQYDAIADAVQTGFFSYFGRCLQGLEAIRESELDSELALRASMEMKMLDVFMATRLNKDRSFEDVYPPQLLKTYNGALRQRSAEFYGPLALEKHRLVANAVEACCDALLAEKVLPPNECKDFGVTELLLQCPATLLFAWIGRLSMDAGGKLLPYVHSVHRYSKRCTRPDILGPGSDGGMTEEDFRSVEAILNPFRITVYLLLQVMPRCPQPGFEVIYKAAPTARSFAHNLYDFPIFSDGYRTRSQWSWRNESESRFTFGRNWFSFVQSLTLENIWGSCLDIQEWLGLVAIRGRTVVDIGCGSGIHSLCFVFYGAKKVLSLDYDKNSVRSAKMMRERFGISRDVWTSEQGSILDRNWISSLGVFDFVYSWGVLMHTGDMWSAVSNAATLVAPNGGILFVAIYAWHVGWRAKDIGVKRAYTSLQTKQERVHFFCEHYPFYCKQKSYQLRPIVGGRGMNPIHDALDWLGGLPYEVALGDNVRQFLVGQGQFVEEVSLVYGEQNAPTNNKFLFRRLASMD